MIVNRTEFKAAIGLVAQAARVGKNDPIGLGAVDMSAQGGRLTLRCCDLSVNLSASCPFEGDALSVALDAGRVLAITNQASGADIEFKAQDGFVRISCGSASYTLPVEERAPPALSAGDVVASAIVSGPGLTKAIQQALASVSPTEHRDYLKGLCFEAGSIDSASDASHLCLFGGDGRTHSMRAVAAEISGHWPHSYLMKPSAALFAKFAASHETVTLSAMNDGDAGGRLKIAAGETEIVSTLIDVSRQVPWREFYDRHKSPKGGFCFAAESLREAVASVAPVFDRRHGDLQMKVTDIATVTANERMTGARAEASCPVTDMGEPEVRSFSVNISLLSDILANWNGADVHIMPSEHLSAPVMFLDPDRGGQAAMLMRLRDAQ